MFIPETVIIETPGIEDQYGQLDGFKLKKFVKKVGKVVKKVAIPLAVGGGVAALAYSAFNKKPITAGAVVGATTAAANFAAQALPGAVSVAGSAAQIRAIQAETARLQAEAALRAQMQVPYSQSFVGGSVEAPYSPPFASGGSAEYITPASTAPLKPASNYLLPLAAGALTVMLLKG